MKSHKCIDCDPNQVELPTSTMWSYFCIKERILEWKLFIGFAQDIRVNFWVRIVHSLDCLHFSEAIFGILSGFLPEFIFLLASFLQYNNQSVNHGCVKSTLLFERVNLPQFFSTCRLRQSLMLFQALIARIENTLK